MRKAINNHVARYYEPETGRFISEDTYRGDGEVFWNVYMYCSGDPVNNTDATGHKYDKNKAVQYARKYAMSRNKDFPFHYALFGLIDTDCTNFTSQCLYAGGIPMDNTWYCKKYETYRHQIYWKESTVWNRVNEQYKYFSKSSKYIKGKIKFDKTTLDNVVKYISVGDIAYLDPDGNGVPNHSIIISKINGNKIEYCGHSHPRKDASLDDNYFKEYGTRK